MLALDAQLTAAEVLRAFIATSLLFLGAAFNTVTIIPAAVDEIARRVQQWSRTQDDDLTLLMCDYVAG